jgi:hypothetical protein
MSSEKQLTGPSSNGNMVLASKSRTTRPAISRIQPALRNSARRNGHYREQEIAKRSLAEPFAAENTYAPAGTKLPTGANRALSRT